MGRSEHTTDYALAISLAKREGEEVKVFLLGDAASCAKSGQTLPRGYYNIGRMLKLSRERWRNGGLRNLYGRTGAHG